MKAVLNRFKEPSSWAGIATLAVLFGVPQNTAEVVVQAVGAVAAVVAIVVPEKAPAEVK